MTGSTNPGESFVNMAPSVKGADALILGFDEKKGFFGHPSNAQYALRHATMPCIVIADHAGAEAL